VAIQRGRDSLPPINYRHVIRTSIVVALSYLFGLQQNQVFKYLSDDAIDVDSVREIQVGSASTCAKSWPRNATAGFWDSGWRSVEFFESKRKPHPEEDVKFFGEGQDQAVLALLSKKRGGSFIDLAAHQAVTLSNTYALERQFGWTGVCIEANHVNLADLVSMRTCQVAMATVGNEKGLPVDFAHGGGAGGLGGIVKDGMDNTQKKNRGRIKRYYTVPLLEILERFQAPATIDYLSLDIEGAEFYVMERFPFNKYTFKVMTVERPEPKLMTLLHSAGYHIIKKIKYDVLYVHKSALEEVRPNYAVIDVVGEYGEQTQTKWQLVPPETTDPKFAI